MVGHAGYLARVVLGIDRSATFGLADAIDHMTTWVRDFTAGVAGDDLDPAKGGGKLLEFLLRDVAKGRTLPNGWENGLSEEQRRTEERRGGTGGVSTCKMWGWPLP